MHGWPQAYQLFTGTVNLSLVLFFFTTDLRPAVLSLSIKECTLQDTEGKHAWHYNDNINQKIALNDGLLAHIASTSRSLLEALVWVILYFFFFLFNSFLFLIHVKVTWKLLKKRHLFLVSHVTDLLKIAFFFFFLSRQVFNVCMFNTLYVDVQFKWCAWLQCSFCIKHSAFVRTADKHLRWQKVSFRLFSARLKNVVVEKMTLLSLGQNHKPWWLFCPLLWNTNTHTYVMTPAPLVWCLPECEITHTPLSPFQCVRVCHYTRSCGIFDKRNYGLRWGDCTNQKKSSYNSVSSAASIYYIN